MSLRITNGFNKLNNAMLATRTAEIIAAMTGNANFPDPSPPLTAVQTKLNEFNAAINAAGGGDRVQIAIREQKRAELITLLHALSTYVLFASNNDRTVAMSSKFSVAKEPSPAPPITKPENLQLKEGDNRGELKVSFTKVAGATSYLYQYAADPITEETVWNIQSGTTRQMVLKNLKSGKRYWCKVAAVGRNNQEKCCDAVSHIVQ